MRPKLLELALVETPLGLNIVWFHRLKNSNRISNFTRSVMAVSFMKPQSKLAIPGPRSGLRPALPCVPRAERANVLGSNQ